MREASCQAVKGSSRAERGTRVNLEAALSPGEPQVTAALDGILAATMGETLSQSSVKLLSDP